MPNLDRDAVAAAMREHGTVTAAARALDTDRRRLAEFISKHEDLSAIRNGWTHATSAAKSRSEASGMQVKDGAALVTGDVLAKGLKAQDAEGYLRKRWGLPEDTWVVMSVTVNEWQGPKAGGEVVTFAQAKGVFRRRVDLAAIIPSPAGHVPDLVRPRALPRPSGTPELIVVEGDHQAPYHDPGLDACATEFVRDLQPNEHVFLGDGMDFPTISRHPDHPSAMATPQECVDAYYHILRRRAEAAPNARRRKLKGNHDWRLEGEVLARSERMWGLRPADSDIPAIGVRNLLSLDKLGIELIEDIRGWEHAEVVLVPGGNGLVVRHGLVTGHNTAGRTMNKLGRSMLVGHDHSKEHAFRLVYPKQRLQQGMVIGAMCRNDEVFPHFAKNPDWHQGFATVTRWPNGAFVLEHTIYHDGSLYWRDRRWDAPLDLLSESIRLRVAKARALGC